jgi:glycosyltransferase involved in cell wall biosynthesis
MIAEALVARGATVTFAHGDDPEQLRRFDDAFPELRARLTCVSVKENGSFHGGSALAALGEVAASAEHVLVANLDEFASGLFRAAALRGSGSVPASVAGRLRGIYIRPRPLDPDQRGMKTAWKRVGLRRLLGGGTIARLGVLDEYLVERLAAVPGGPQATWIPDFWRPLAAADRSTAREDFGIPESARALLFFGVSHARKGLDLAIEAFEHEDLGEALLFVAGAQRLDPAMARRLEQLVRRKRAVVHDRFLSEVQMGAAFAACDQVLVPYRRHYGSSSVLSVAASAERPVIASDHHVLGRRVAEWELGRVFRDGDAASLAAAIHSMPSEQERATWARGMRRWADKTSPAAFGQAIWSLLTV